MDRLSALALGPVLLSLISVPGKRLRKVLAAGVILLLLAVISLQSARRVTETGMGILDWAALYLQLGTINLALLMRSPIHHTYGLFGILSPVTWVAKSLGFSLLPDTSSFDWSWGPFQSAFGYMFLDFGWLSVAVFLIFGSLARRIDDTRYGGGTRTMERGAVDNCLCCGVSSHCSGVRWYGVLVALNHVCCTYTIRH